MDKVKGVYCCDHRCLGFVYGPEYRAAIARRLDISDTLVTRQNLQQHRDLLSEAEIIVSSWGGAVLDAELLAAMPRLKLYCYGAGSVHGLITDAVWERGIRITSAVALNAVPVAEFVVAQTIYSLKQGWKYMQMAKADSPDVWQFDKPVQGMYRTKVGLIGFGMIARKTAALLQHFDVEVYASSLYPDQTAGVTFISTEEIFRTCDVISLHLPLNESTTGLIGRSLLETMKPHATLINTARGAVVNQAELIEILRTRPDIHACLDVTAPEPPASDCPLFDLPNVVLTPHLAGSTGYECRRMGKFVVEEIDRYLAGQPLEGEITRASFDAPA